MPRDRTRSASRFSGSALQAEAVATRSPRRIAMHRGKTLGMPERTRRARRKVSRSAVGDQGARLEHRSLRTSLHLESPPATAEMRLDPLRRERRRAAHAAMRRPATKHHREVRGASVVEGGEARSDRRRLRLLVTATDAARAVAIVAIRAAASETTGDPAVAETADSRRREKAAAR